MKPEPRKFTMAPMGLRWPWLPCYRTTVTVESADPKGVDLNVVGKVDKGRVGLRLWLQHIGRCIRHANPPEGK